MNTENRLNPANMSKTKEAYESPVIEIVEIKVEQGVQMSGEMGDDPNGSDPTY